jgi:hypothetical protein
MSMDFGLCWGPVDQLVQVYFKEKEGFDGEDSIIGSGSIHVNKPDLFGGYEREGGIVGEVAFRNGGSLQLIPAGLAERMGVDRNNAPGYRDIACLAYHGDENSDRAGGSVSCNNPSVPPIWSRLRRSSKTLGVNTNVIYSGGGSDKGTRMNANPAAFLHELIVDDHWGMSGDNADLNIPSFTSAAQTLFDEGFGISLIWAKQSSIESMAQEVLDHINGMLYFHPYTGKATLKLIRNDYDPNTLPQYGPDQCDLTSFKRKLFSETINEVVVTWTQPDSEEEATITYQDPGNIGMQGDVVSVNRNYYMIRDEALASMVCKRDLQSESAPLASVSFKVDRTQWNSMPGDCIKFKWPDYNIDNVILRVLDIDWGTVDNSQITVNAVEDIFSFQLAEFAIPGGPVWTDPGQDPNGGDYFEMIVKFFAAPLSLIQQDFGSAGAPYLIDENYPQILIAAAVTPKPATYDANGNIINGQPDLQSFFMWEPGVDTTGAAEWQSLGEKQITGKGKLLTPVVPEVRTTITIGNRIGGDGPEVGRYAIIGDGDEFTDEWVLFETNHGGGTWTVRRGVLDTTPKRWSANTSLYFISLNFDAYDTTGALAEHIENYKLQPRTSKGIRSLEGTQVVGTIRPDRPYRPYRPANCKIENVMFGTRDDSQIPEETHEPRAIWTYSVSWSRRNRFLEENVVLPWDGGDVMPEDGQTTSILVMSGPDGTGKIISRIDDLTGTSTTFDIIVETGTLTGMSLKFISVRNGLESLQGHAINLALYIKGFGSDWGYLYGGWPKIGNIGTEFSGDLTLPPADATGDLDN